MMLNDVFKDLKVIELAGVLAGPSVGYFFAELGAEVIKIENPKTKGDVTRSWKLKTEDPNQPYSAYYWSVNAFKKTLFLDLSNDDDKKHFYDLLPAADVIITNYKKGDDKKLGVDYDTLSKLRPELIYASINGFGSESPRSAYDLILQAESGFMAMNGNKEGDALKMPVALIDLLAGHQLKEAILIALIKKLKTGKGAQVSVSLFDSAIASLANQATNWLQAAHLPKPMGSLHPNIAPYGEIFESKDHHLFTFAIGSNTQFHALCELIQFRELAADKRFVNNPSRVRNRAELYSILYNYFHALPFEQVYALCAKRQIPIGKIRNLKEVFELPEAKTMLRHFELGKESKTVVSSLAFKFHA
ncbi:MAG: CoA transferase [Bacteroidia bacterium]|nr:CoA transferase [Bacteroidia bacterium]